MSIKLDIGSGPNPRAGFTGVDIASLPGVVMAPMWDLPYPDQQVDEIFSRHALEHVEKRKVVPTLAEWRRVLKTGGRLVVEVPDLVWCCENWLQHPDAGWNMDAIFGTQDHPGQFHLTGFTPEIMAEYFIQAGWTESIQCSQVWDKLQNTLRFEATKGNDPAPVSQSAPVTPVEPAARPQSLFQMYAAAGQSEAYLTRLSEQLEQRQVQIQSLQNQIRDIEDSHSWRWMRGAQKIRLRLIPPGSRREKWLERALALFRA